MVDKLTIKNLKEERPSYKTIRMEFSVLKLVNNLRVLQQQKSSGKFWLKNE